jgi:hypothetical protein
MGLQTRSQQRVLNALTAKLETLPPNHPDRSNLLRTILGLGRKLDASPQGDRFAGARHARRRRSAWPLDHRGCSLDHGGRF